MRGPDVLGSVRLFSGWAGSGPRVPTTTGSPDRWQCFGPSSSRTRWSSCAWSGGCSRKSPVDAVMTPSYQRPSSSSSGCHRRSNPLPFCHDFSSRADVIIMLCCFSGFLSPVLQSQSLMMGPSATPCSDSTGPYVPPPAPDAPLQPHALMTITSHALLPQPPTACWQLICVGSPLLLHAIRYSPARTSTCTSRVPTAAPGCTPSPCCSRTRPSSRSCSRITSARGAGSTCTRPARVRRGGNHYLLLHSLADVHVEAVSG